MTTATPIVEPEGLSDSILSWEEALEPRDTPVWNLAKKGLAYRHCLETRVEPGKDPERAMWLRIEAKRLQAEEEGALISLGIDPDDDDLCGDLCRKADDLRVLAHSLDDQMVCVRYAERKPVEWGQITWGQATVNQETTP